MKIIFMTLMNITKLSDNNPTENIKVDVVKMLLCPGNSRILFSVGRHTSEFTATNLAK